MAQQITIEIHGPHCDASIRREHRHAYGDRGGMVDLVISRERGIWSVYWNVHNGRAWRSGWTATFRGIGAEGRAMAFADKKWPVLTKWLEDLEPERSGGAAEAFKQ